MALGAGLSAFRLSALGALRWGHCVGGTALGLTALGLTALGLTAFRSAATGWDRSGYICAVVIE
ncbi:hypothetical protein RSSM_02456 [Rhodopirellula sallentina SM41]|uniref:Uncharacterized protein n=1 Tax=Rhodopirellula sallentina SM41 TaxID=1263870 RepID=M5UE34_9BACT|nr:hypothetical protein RSSM_02456 [Rhodopirellula sallentina SM41]